MQTKFTTRIISLLLVFLSTFSLQSNATIFVVTVANFSFSPANIPDVIVGDTLRWVWASGFHNSNSTSVPTGAPTWFGDVNDVAGNTNHVFDYKVTVPGSYAYNCTIHPVAMIATFTASAPLPVTLSSFKVANVSNNAILKWVTESEDNIDYFSVQKSKTGSDYVEIGRVRAAGHSTATKVYKFTDINSNSADRYAYYTVAIVDKEGKKQFTPVELFRNTSATSRLILSLGPNPVTVSGHLMLKFNADRAGKMNVKLTNVEGKSVLETTMQASEGVNNSHLMLNSVPAGSYSLHFELNGVNENYKIIVR